MLMCAVNVCCYYLGTVRTTVVFSLWDNDAVKRGWESNGSLASHAPSASVQWVVSVGNAGRYVLT